MLIGCCTYIVAKVATQQSIEAYNSFGPPEFLFSSSSSSSSSTSPRSHLSHEEPLSPSSSSESDWESSVASPGDHRQTLSPLAEESASDVARFENAYDWAYESTLVSPITHQSSTSTYQGRFHTKSPEDWERENLRVPPPPSASPLSYITAGKPLDSICFNEWQIERDAASVAHAIPALSEEHERFAIEYLDTICPPPLPPSGSFPLSSLPASKLLPPIHLHSSIFSNSQTRPLVETPTALSPSSQKDVWPTTPPPNLRLTPHASRYYEAIGKKRAREEEEEIPPASWISGCENRAGESSDFSKRQRLSPREAGQDSDLGSTLDEGKVNWRLPTLDVKMSQKGEAPIPTLASPIRLRPASRRFQESRARHEVPTPFTKREGNLTSFPVESKLMFVIDRASGLCQKPWEPQNEVGESNPYADEQRYPPLLFFAQDYSRVFDGKQEVFPWCAFSPFTDFCS